MIILTGAEASGKSTVSRLLMLIVPKSGHLKFGRLGKRVAFDDTYCDHLLAYLFQKLLILLGRKEIHIYPNGYQVIEPDYNVIAKLLSLWYLLQLISFFARSIKNLFLALLGFTVLWERGPISFLSYIAFMEYYLQSRIRKLKLGKKFKSLLPRTQFTARLFYLMLRSLPHVIVFLKCDPRLLEKRQQERGTPVIPHWIVNFRLLVEEKALKEYYKFIPLVEVNTTGQSPLETFLCLIRKFKDLEVV